MQQIRRVRDGAEQEEGGSVLESGRQRYAGAGGGGGGGGAGTATAGRS